VFNWALADRKAAYELTGESGSMYEQKKRFNELKRTEYAWTYDYPYTILESAFGHVDLAYKNFFRRIKAGDKPGYPKFKSRHDRKSFTLRGNISVTDTHIKLPRIGWVKLAERGYLPTEGVKIFFANISESAGDWFVSLQVEEADWEVTKNNRLSLGIDLGVKSSAVLSNGKVFDNAKPGKGNEKKLARLQRKLSRQVLRSANWYKTKAKIRKLQNKIANIRKHNQHEISSYAVKQVRPSCVIVEDLNVNGMTAKVKPKPNENGGYDPNGRAAKSGLAKAVLDVGMGEISRQIEYKADWQGVGFVKADRWYPSTQTCASCGYRHEGDNKLSLDDRIFTCLRCGYVEDRDLNAAKNLAVYEPVMNGGLPVELAELSATVKQEGSRDLSH
jgi:putative transposase